MEERTEQVTMKGNPLTLVGSKIQVGDKAPDTVFLNNDLEPVTLSDYRDQLCVIVSVPSLDTPVCDMETRRFNQEAESLGQDVKILTVSMESDPFATKAMVRSPQALIAWLRSPTIGMLHSARRMECSSKSFDCWPRAVFIIDREGVVRYIQLVKELTQEPDYDAVLSALKEIA